MKCPIVEIFIQNPSGLSVFKIDDIIRGEVLFTPRSAINLENIDISFQGYMAIETENLDNHIPLAPNTLKRTFLRVDFPLEGNVSEFTFEPEKTHRIPFSFVVPSQIPVQMCNHACANSQLYHEHLQMPPSLGNVYQYFDDHVHDMSPQKAEIKYSINFSLLEKISKGDWPKTLRETIHPIYIMPRRAETAPLLVGPRSNFYKTNSNKVLTKGILRGRLGTMTISSFQPPGINLHNLNGPLRENHSEASTTVRLNLRFEPECDKQIPPRMLSTDIKLRAITFFGMETWHEFPDQLEPATWGSRQTFWSETVHLLSANQVIEWYMQRKPNSSGSSGSFYTASVDVQVKLVNGYIYPPNFHSCLVSRTYAIKAKLLYKDHEKTRTYSSMTLSIPVQIYAP